MKKIVITVLLALPAAAGCNGQFGDPFSPAARGVSAREQAVADEDAFTILLCILRDPATHVRDANHYRRMLIKDAGWKDLVVIHKVGHSVVMWGRYASVDDAQGNLAKARAYRPPSGQPLFAQALVVPYPCKDIGPAELNLKNVKAAYSLLVAVFKNDPEHNYVGRRKRAVELCQRLRKKGYEAYFHHGPAGSDVTIGAFGTNSVRARQTPSGTQFDILDPQIKALQRQFPHVLLNGNTIADITRDSRTGRITSKDVKETYLVRIPEGDSGYVP